MSIRSSHKIFWLGIITGIVLSAVLAFLYLQSPSQKNRGSEDGPDIAIAQTTQLLPDEKNTISVFEKAAPAVVFITNKALRRDFFSLDVFEIPQGSGSGFLWDKKGNIVTNYHVIANASALTVTLSDHSSYEARVIGEEPNKDLAVVRIDAPEGKLRPLPVGSSSNLRVGQKVIAIGNPFGLDQTLTSGVVSALGREFKSVTNRTIRDVIQTDTAINPGNSGGPLLDSGSNLIGVNTAIISPSGAYSGVGFAVPVNTVKQVVPQLIQHGKVIRPGLGINVLSDSVAERLDIEGIIIADVVEGGSADRAGLQGVRRTLLDETTLGDVIIGINDEEVKNSDELSTVLEQFKIGDTVTVKFLRDGEKKETEVQLQQIN